MNEWEMMIGAPPTGPEQTAGMAKKLRGQSDLGMLGMLSGNQQLGGVGKSLYSGAQTKGEGLQKTRQQEAQRNMLNEMYGNQDERSRIQMTETERHNRMMEANNRFKAEQASNESGISQKDMMRYRKDLGRDIVKSEIPAIKSAMEGVNTALAEYGPDADLPGIGAGKYWKGEEARDFRNKLAPIENILLKARSGAAVTEQEYQRFRRELLGEGVFASDKNFRDAWARLQNQIAAKEKSIYQGYDPAVVDYYNSGLAEETERRAGKPAETTVTEEESETITENAPGSVTEQLGITIKGGR